MPNDTTQGRAGWPAGSSRRAATITNLVHQYVTIIVTIVNGLILPPLYLKYIGLGLYGAWLASGEIVAWTAVMEAGVNDLIRQQSAKAYGERSAAALGEVIGTGLLVNTLLSVLPFLAGLCIAPWVPGVFRVEGAEAEVLSLSFAVASLAVTLMLLASGPGAVQQGLQRNISHCVIYVISATAGVVATVVMLVSGWGLLSIPAGLLVRWVVGTVLYWGYIVVFLRHVLRIPVKVSRGRVRAFIHLASWTLGSRLSQTLAVNSDRFFVALLLGKEITPILSFTYRAWEVVQLFVGRVSTAFMPGLAHLYGEGNLRQYRLISLKLMRVVAVAMAIGCGGCLTLNRGFMTLWLGRGDLFAGETFNLLLVAATFLAIMTLTLRQVLFALGRVRQTSAADILCSLVRTGLLVSLLVGLRLLAVPVSTILATLAVAVWYFAWQWARALSISAAELAGELWRAGKVLLPVILLGWLWRYVPQPWVWGQVSRAAGWGLLALSAAGYVAAAGAITLVLDRGSRQMAAGIVRRVLGSVGLRGRR